MATPNQIPFTVRAKIVPERGLGKRMEIQRSRERIAALIYTNLLSSFTSGNIATPGGNATWSYGNDVSSFANTVNIVAVKPQFGNQPDMVTITGFYNPTGSPDTVPPYPTVTRILANTRMTGGASGAPGWSDSYKPTAANSAQVKALKLALETAIVDAVVTIITIEYNGVKYGQNGYHFPQ